MSRFTIIFQLAAERIKATSHFPGQSIPGFWDLKSHPPGELIGVIIGNALAGVARERDEPFDPIVERFMQVIAGVEMTVKGDPAAVATARLMQAADLNAKTANNAGDRLAALAGLAVHLIHRFSLGGDMTAEEREGAETLVQDIQRAIADQRASRA